MDRDAKNTFEKTEAVKAYCNEGPQPMRLDFGFGLQKLWEGKKIFRRNWNGKGMYLALQVPDFNSKMSCPYIYMRTADNQLVPWVASQTDILANDWEVFK